MENEIKRTIFLTAIIIIAACNNEPPKPLVYVVPATTVAAKPEVSEQAMIDFGQNCLTGCVDKENGLPIYIKASACTCACLVTMTNMRAAHFSPDSDPSRYTEFMATRSQMQHCLDVAIKANQ